jgi:iron complex outermembrane receptor protein
MKRIVLTTLIIFSVSVALFAQKKVRGKVFDAKTNSPLAGATIGFQGKNVSITDKDGLFSVDCSGANAVTVSFVGYETRKEFIKNCDDELSIGLVSVNNNLNEVEITATSNPNKSILYQPSSITKLTPGELKRSQGLFLDDAINGNVPGVTMQRRAVSSGQQFNIRGYGNGSGGTGRINSNFDGQGYKVYLNNIPITDAEGITLMDDIDFGSVGNVEVTKGPAGTLYGLAVAGVVNLSTVKPEKGKTSLGQNILLGSYGLQRYTTHFETAGEHSSLLLNYGHQKTDGYTIHNASRKDFVNATGNFNISDYQSLGFYFGYSKSYDERSGELTIAQYNIKDYSGNPEYIKRNGHSETTSFRAGVTHTYNFTKNISNTTTVFGSGLTNNASSAAGWTDKDPINYGFRSTMNMAFSLGRAFSISGTTGAEGQQQTAQTVGYGMIDPQGTAHVWKAGDPYFVIGSTAAGSNGITSNKYTQTGTLSAFTEWTLSMSHDISITAGIGMSNMRINLKDRYYVAANTQPTQFDTTYKTMLSPHLAINKVFNKSFSAYFSYSKGYKAPVSSYFYIPFVTAAPGNTGVINQGLKPEVGNQFEIGTKGTVAHGRLVYQLALFNAIFSNKMTAINVLNTAGTTTLYSYVANSGKQNDKGVEALLKYTLYQSGRGFIKSIAPFGNFTWSDFKYSDYSFHYKGTVLKDSVVNYDRKAVAGVAKFVGNLGIDITANCGLYANVTYFYKDGFPISSDGINNTGSYSLLNAKLGFQHSISKHFDFDAYFGANNITSTQYPMMVFVNQLPDAYMAGPLKANYYGGINVKYNF